MRILIVYSLLAGVALAQEFPPGVYPGGQQPTQSASGPSAEAAPTPYAEVVRVIGLLPKPQQAFVDYGCGAEARWCIVAAEKWGCKCIGIEIDPVRAAMAKQRVMDAGLSDLITIIEGDSTQIDVQADVGCGYLYPKTLGELKPKIEKLRAFASYRHQVPNLPMVANGDTFLYSRPAQAPAVRPKAAVWGNQIYYAPVCNAPGCRMCEAIRAALQSQ